MIFAKLKDGLVVNLGNVTHIYISGFHDGKHAVLIEFTSKAWTTIEFNTEQEAQDALDDLYDKLIKLGENK